MKYSWFESLNIDLDARVEQLQKEEEEGKKRRKERKKAKKKGESGQNVAKVAKEEDSPEDEVDPEMAKFMGYHFVFI